MTRLVTSLNKNKDKTILLFGFTSIVYENFYKDLEKNNLKLDYLMEFLFMVVVGRS